MRAADGGAGSGNDRRGAVGWNELLGALVAAFPNAGFMGVPLLVALLGPRPPARIVALAIDMVVTSSLCIALSRLDGASHHRCRATVGNASKAAEEPAAQSDRPGTLTAATGLELWEPVRNSAGMQADGASPSRCSPSAPFGTAAAGGGFSRTR